MISFQENGVSNNIYQNRRHRYHIHCRHLIHTVFAASLLAILYSTSSSPSMSSYDPPSYRNLQSNIAATTTRKITQQLMPPPPSTPPNILLIVLDQWRYDWDGFHTDTPTGPLPLNVPFLQSFATEGTRFTQAYCPAPLCAPSRACFASGMEYDATGVLENHADTLPTDRVTFYRLLRDGGHIDENNIEEGLYHTMTCGKDDLFKADINFPYYPDTHYTTEMDLGFSDARRSAGKTKVIREHPPFERLRTYLDDTQVSLMNGTMISAFKAYEACWHNNTGKDDGGLCDASSFTEMNYPDAFVRDEAIELLRRYNRIDQARVRYLQQRQHLKEQQQQRFLQEGEGDKKKPWFLQVNFPGPHPPIMSTSIMAESVKNREWPVPVDGEHDWRWMGCPQQAPSLQEEAPSQPQFGGRCNYAAQIEYIDHLMSTIVDEVKLQEGENFDKNTLICIMGDHGEMLGEHGLHGKKLPWQPSVSVPLMCKGSTVQKGYVYDSPVTTIDVAGTFLDYAGLLNGVDDGVELPEQMTAMSLRPILEGWFAKRSGYIHSEENGGTSQSTENKENFASSLDAVETVMRIPMGSKSTSDSLAGVAGTEDAQNIIRTHVSSGLKDWRMVVKELPSLSSSGTTSYKLVCCKGSSCYRAPSSAKPRVEKQRGGDTWSLLLYDVISDPYDMVPIQDTNEDVVEELRLLLPEGWCPASRR